MTRKRGCQQLQTFWEHEQANTRQILRANRAKVKILRPVKNFNGPFITPTTTFVKFKLFKDQPFHYHPAKNLDMCNDWFYMVTSLLKITRFTIISKSKCFKIHPPLWELGVYKKRLQEVYCRFEISRTLRAAKDERYLLSCLTTVHHSLFLRPHHSWIHGEFEI